MKDIFLKYGILLILIIFSLIYIFKCNKKIEPNINPVIAVTPIISDKEIKKLNLPNLPNKEIPKVVISVPKTKPILGKVVTSHVVVGSHGNTYIARTTKIDWGFRAEPKISLGVSYNFLLGVDLTIFSWNKLNVDLLGYIPIEENFDVKNVRLGGGVSYKITNNTSIGAGYLKDFKNTNSFLGFISFKF